MSWLKQSLAQVSDPRRAQGKRYDLPHVLLYSVLAVASGATSYRKIEQFLQAHWQSLNEAFGSRRVVGFEVHDSDSADHAVALLKRAALAEGLHGRPPEQRPVLHGDNGDNGATLKATTVLAMLHWLKIRPSYSRPRVSDDNAFAESLFRTAKYRPEFPASGGFKDLQAARQWASAFVHWYNHDHRHSGIRFVSPAQRHAGQDRKILAARDALYRQARQANPKRWSGKTRDWSPIGAVTLNPQREGVAAALDAAAAEISRVAV
jgi:transposase InsO family protein